MTRRSISVVGIVLLIAVGTAAAYLARRHDTSSKTAAAPVEDVYTCPMHPEIREHQPGKCPKCGMELVKVAPAQSAELTSAANKEAQPRADLVLDARRRQLAGVRTVRVERGMLTQTLHAPGIVRIDETRQSEITVRLDGWIRDLRADYTGQAIRRGQPLFTLYSPELLGAENEYLLALKSRDDMKTTQIADVREQTERLVSSARARLLVWDVSTEDIDALERTRTARGTFLVRSTVSGVVMEKTAVEGRKISAGETLYKVVDLSSVWIEAEFHDMDAPFLKVGARARVTTDSRPGQTLTGRAIYVYPYVDETSRTTKVRFEFSNADGRLKPGMFANLELDVSVGNGLSIPADALLDSGSRKVVFVSDGSGYFEPRDVQVGSRFEGRVQILSGLKEGEEIVSSATFLVDSESQMRAATEAFQPVGPTPPASAQAKPKFDIQFRTDPDPPKSGEDVFEVTLRDTGGAPVIDAEIQVLFYMAPMPSMNMPAMRTETKLGHIEHGIYRGPGTILVAGRWDVIVTVTRGGERLATRQFTTIAR